MKILILLASLIAVVHLTQCATLRRKPKVYNALITTDQNLTPSRAYPIIQPHLQETYAYPSFSYRSSYAPFGLYNSGFQYGSAAAAASSITSYNAFNSYPRGLIEARNYFPRDEISTVPPIPLNNFGLPPSIVPLNSFGFGHNSHNLAPYPYNSYPLIYDQFGGYGSANPYLPPFSFYPSELDASSSSAGKGNNNGNGNDEDGNSNNGNGFANGGKGTGENGGVGGAGGNAGGSGAASGASGSGGGGSGASGSSGGGSGASGSSGGGGGGGAESSSGSSGGSSSSVSSSSSSTKSSRARNFDKPEQQHQLLNENIKNFANKDPSIPDVPIPPLPSGAKKAIDK